MLHSPFLTRGLFPPPARHNCTFLAEGLKDGLDMDWTLEKVQFGERFPRVSTTRRIRHTQHARIGKLAKPASADSKRHGGEGGGD